ncbi:MAG: sigma-54-dependent transcriptional regulator [Planctomycetota bacterium]|jgi:DNA-binding NtrC family response regulator
MSPPGEARRVLLVDDDDTFRRVMSAELERRGHTVISAPNGEAALAQADAADADVILLDLRLPDIDGIDVLKRLRDREVAAGVVVLTGHGAIETAIEAIRLGAYDYLEKPCPVEQVEMAIRKTHEHLALQRRERVLHDGYMPPDIALGLVGESPGFQKLRQTVAKIAASDATTLIQGETGTGKEMVAMLLHRQSPRSETPFVVVDCVALHEELLQSELFGHEKGAFTGAARLKHGLFEVADGGTLFLDEVGDTSPEVQAKLLRVLETGRFRRLGGTKEIAVDVRVISATNRNLRDAVSKGRFREDLFFRLVTLTVEIPPLRERKEDIPLLVEHFTRRFNRRFSLACRFSPPSVEVLCRYRWPGNVRELIHVVEQTVVLAECDVIEPHHLPAEVRSSGAASADEEEIPSLQEIERRHVVTVMEKVGGKRAQAARILGISERNLYRLLKKCGWPLRSSNAADGS